MGYLGYNSVANIAAVMTAFGSVFSLIAIAMYRRQIIDIELPVETASNPDLDAVRENERAQSRVIDKISAICQRLCDGDLEARISDIRETGMLTDVQCGVNDVIARCEAAVRKADATLDAAKTAEERADAIAAELAAAQEDAHAPLRVIGKIFTVCQEISNGNARRRG